MDISWVDAQTFLAIAEGGSISAGAGLLGLGQPTVSRRVALLEERVGCALFLRGRQGVELTEAGVRLRPAAEQMARWASEFERIASGHEAETSGVVRITAPPGVAVDLLPLLAAQLGRAHPELRLEVQASIEHLDLNRGEADLAIRTRPSSEPGLITIAQAETAIGVFAARRYVETLAARRLDAGRTGPPDLSEIDWVTWSKPYEHVEPRPMLERAVKNFSPRFASDSYLVLRAAVSAGLGAMVLDRRAATRPGIDPLVEIDLGFALPSSAFYLVSAKSAQYIPRVRVVADAIVAGMQAETYVCA